MKIKGKRGWQPILLVIIIVGAAFFAGFKLGMLYEAEYGFIAAMQNAGYSYDHEL